MPIIFNTETKKWRLDNPTEDEMRSIEEVAVDYITSAIAKMFGLKGMSMGPIPEGSNGEEKSTMVPIQAANDEQQPEEEEKPYNYDFHFTNPKKH